MGVSLKTLKNEISIDSQFAAQKNEHEIRVNYKDSQFTGTSASDFTEGTSGTNFDLYFGQYRLYSTTTGIYGSQVYTSFETIPGQYYTFHYDYVTRLGSTNIQMGLVSEEPSDPTTWTEKPWLATFNPLQDQAITFKAQSEITYFIAAHFSTANNTDYIRFDSLRIIPSEIPQNLQIEQFNIRTPSTNTASYNVNSDEYYEKYTYGDKAYFRLENLKLLLMTKQSEITIRGKLND
jgi:hypothetical protein